jgi:hypothetical protein
MAEKLDNVIIAEVLARAARDDQFRQKLTQDPNGTFTQAGIRVPAGVTFKVLQDTATLKHVVVPATPLPPQARLDSLPRNPTPLQVTQYLITRGQSDAAFKQRAINNTEAVLSELGVRLPPGITIKVVPNSDRERYVVLPAARRQPGQLDDMQLAGVAGGKGDVTAVKTNVNVTAEAMANEVAVANVAGAVNVAGATNVGAAAEVLVVAGIVLQ